MRRKSTRNAQKATPDKPLKETESPKTRRSKRRKRTPSKSSESEDEALVTPKPAEPEETPDTTTKSHTPTDDETSEEPVWKVTSSEDAPQGEIQKLKICLTRPSPDSPEKSKSRRSKSNSQTEDDATSSEDKSSSTTRRTRSRGSPLVRNDGLSSQEADEDVEDKKGKGKSKGKHKSKIEKSPHLSEPEIQTNNEISENVQVTPQSPSIDKPVDNESDYNKVDVDVIQNVNESTQKQRNDGEESATNLTSKCNAAEDDCNDVKQSQTDDSQKTDVKNKESDDDEPLSVIQKSINAQQEEEQESVAEVAASQEQEITTSEDVQKEETSAVQSETEVLETKEPSQEVKTDTCEEAQEPPTQTESVETSPEKPVTREEVSEVEPQNTSQDVSMQEVEENTTDDRVRLQSESESRASPPKTPEVATTSKEKRPEGEKRPPRRRLRRNNEPSQSDSKEEENRGEENSGLRPFKNRRKWEGGAELTSSMMKIDLESIQVVWPSIDFPEEPDLHLEMERERRKSVAEPAKKSERKVSLEYKSDSSEKPTYEKQSSVNSTNSTAQESEDNANIIAFNRKISIVDDTASKLRPPPSPAKNPVSEILYITNLVRPFTLKQLKELLERTGKIQEEGFWTDRIKSKCYVQYETAEEAEATRNALHGVQWPIGNGKKLIIDYATVEDMKNAKNPPPPPMAPPVADAKPSVKENVEPVELKARRSEEKIPKEVEKKKSEGPVREWDIGKKDVRRERSRSRERSRKHRRSPTPDDFISRKQRKAEESVPQKLMDDLFLKTKATPSIYWQPLSPEEISMKQQQRLIRMEEHKRRMEENSRMKGRDMGRGAFRRRYD